MILVWQPDKWNFVCVDHCGTLFDFQIQQVLTHDHICTLGSFWPQKVLAIQAMFAAGVDKHIEASQPCHPCETNTKSKDMKALFVQNQRQHWITMKHGKARSIPVRLIFVVLCHRAILAILLASEAHSGHLCWNMAQAIALVDGGDPAAAKKKLGSGRGDGVQPFNTYSCHIFLGE